VNEVGAYSARVACGTLKRDMAGPGAGIHYLLCLIVFLFCHLGEDSFEKRRHEIQLLQLDHQIPERFKLFPTRCIEEVFHLMLRRSVKQARLNNRTPPVEVTVGLIIPTR